jgi:hypothetical protein
MEVKDKILRWLDEQIEDCETLKAQASGHNMENILGTINAYEDVKEFVEGLEEEKE